MNSIILLISCLWIRNIQALCPLPCSCKLNSVLCFNQSLNGIPYLDSLEVSPVILDFSGNSLFILSDEAFNFPKSEEVKEVYLNNSEIAVIEDSTFDHLENLQELYLGNNLLNTDNIPERFIEMLDSMVLLDLSYNQLSEGMPIIRSKSLEVLVLVNSKISSMSKDVLKHLPSLEHLDLQQNYIKSLHSKVFEWYSPNSLEIKLAFNPWSCSCHNLRTFNVLKLKGFLETAEPYQCINSEGKTINIFNNSEDIKIINQKCNVDNEEKIESGSLLTETNLEYLDTNINDENSEAEQANNCWAIFDYKYNDNAFLSAIAISSIIGFLIGFIVGLICCRIAYIFRFKKLEQSSESQVQLIQA